MNRRNMKESSPADVDHGSLPGGAQPESEAGSQPRGRLHAIWDTIGAVIGVVMGLVPHVLHHIGLIAGAALVTGAGGKRTVLRTRPGLLHPVNTAPLQKVPLLVGAGDRDRDIRRHVLAVGVRYRTRHHR